MTRYEYIENGYRIFYNGLTERHKILLQNNSALEGELYTTFVGFVECMLNGIRWYKNYMDELTDEEFSNEILSYKDALKVKVEMNTGLFNIKNKVYEDTIKFLQENGNDVRSYVQYMEDKNV